ncbi:MAG: hypothetical protein WCG32_01285 [Actinomycetes bacterium]
MSGQNTFEPGWFRQSGLQDLSSEYLRAIHLVNEDHGAVTALAQCRDCEIHFLTVASNGGRLDMRCPLGCRQHSKEQKSSVRSTEYYQTEQGLIKRKALNRKRSESGPGEPSPGKQSPILPAVLISAPSLREHYYRWLIRLIDGFLIELPVLAALLHRIRRRLQPIVRQQGRDRTNEVRNNRDD